jgi:hypothetical protein
MKRKRFVDREYPRIPSVRVMSFYRVHATLLAGSRPADIAPRRDPIPPRRRATDRSVTRGPLVATCQPRCHNPRTHQPPLKEKQPRRPVAPPFADGSIHIPSVVTVSKHSRHEDRPRQGGHTFDPRNPPSNSPAKGRKPGKLVSPTVSRPAHSHILTYLTGPNSGFTL